MNTWEKFVNLTKKPERYVIGLMSGTSVDGTDAALVKIRGSYTETETELLAFETFPIPAVLRARIFNLFNSGSSEELCRMNFLLGELFADAAIQLCKNADFPLADIDLIGSHGQTIYHIPSGEAKSTLQIGDGSVIAHRCGVATICDFRTADMAAGGVGAPLVPYTEFLMHSSDSENIALLNLGGIGNITIIPKNARAENIIAFDTGPGNMMIDFFAQKLYGVPFDKDGKLAANGMVNVVELARLLSMPYINEQPPKATGRELFGVTLCENLLAAWNNELADADIMATVTAFTAYSVAHSAGSFVPHLLNKLIVGGGGAYNSEILRQLRELLPGIAILTQEDLNQKSDAKEAIAFAVLANETLFGNPGNLPSVTGASGYKVLGKVCLP